MFPVHIEIFKTSVILNFKCKQTESEEEKKAKP